MLDSAGYANLVLEVGKSYRLVLTDRFGVVIKEWDNVTASSSGEGGGGGTEYTAGEGIKIYDNVIGLDYLSVNENGEVCIEYEVED